MDEFELVWDSRCGVAESPVWDAATRRLLFSDINGRRINALSVILVRANRGISRTLSVVSDFVVLADWWLPSDTMWCCSIRSLAN
jgi:sugar lactone lactonase YvrE